MSKIIRISDSAYEHMNKLAKETGLSKQSVIEKALIRMVQETLLRQANEAYAQLKKNKKLWDETQAEDKEWEQIFDAFEDSK